MAQRRRADEPRASLAAFLSFLFPGLGQAYNGDRALAALLAIPVLLIVAAAVMAFSGGSSVVSRLVDARFLVGLIVLDLALLGWRLVAIMQAHARRRGFSPRRWTTWATSAVIVVTIGMHLMPAWYATLAIDALGVVSADTPQPSTTGPPVAREGGFDALPPPSRQPEVARGERVNILLVGVDFAPGRTNELTDTMLVVGLDADSGSTSMLSVPRDLWGVPLPDGGVWEAKLNGLMAAANADPASFPLGGPGTLKATMAELLGVPIHYFAAINIIGFKQAVDAIGGVDVTVDRLIDDPLYVNEFGEPSPFYLPPGDYHMDGGLAVAYARSRQGVGDSDFTRAARQQQLLDAIRAKLTAGNLLLALPGLLDSVKNTIATDVPQARLPELAAAVQDADTDAIERAVIQPPLVTPATASDGAYVLIPDLEAIRAVAEDLLGERTTASGG